MFWLIHGLLVLFYLGSGIAFALLAPTQFGLAPEDARWIAGGIILLGAILHLLATTLPVRYRLDRVEDTTRRLVRSHRRISETVNALEEKEQERSRQSDLLIDELKVLQTLLTQALERRGGSKAKPSPATPDAAEAEDSSDETNADTEPSAQPADRRRRPAMRDPGRTRPLPVEDLDEETLLRIIRVALNENRVDLYLQPIVALPSRRHMHYECFSRVRDEDNRLVYPKDFLPLATSSGLVGTVDNLLLFRLIQLVRKLGRRKPEARFFCNIADGSIRDSEFFPQFVDYMVANRAFADRFVFEFRADVFANLDPAAERHLDMLIRSGYRFSLDGLTAPDFEPERLAVRGVGFVKIPKDLLADSVLDWARDLRRRNILPIAERVESEADVVTLIEQEIPLAQGFLFGEPRLARDVTV